MQKLISILSAKSTLGQKEIENILKLLEEGSTIPFIARYRKEMTGGADDETLRKFFDEYTRIKNLFSRKEEIISTLKERELLTPKLHSEIENVTTLTALEDIYRPFKQKRNSRATLAIQRGLEPLADILQKAKLTQSSFEEESKKYCKGEIKSIFDAIKGAQDILAERFSDDPKERDILRKLVQKHGLLEVKATKNFQKDGQYQKYQKHSEKVAYIPSHRYLAIMRGVKEKELLVKITIDTDRYFETLYRFRIKDYMQDSKELLFKAYTDGFSRLLFPSIEREIHALLKERSDRAAIAVFGKNLTQLLMTPPVTKRVLLGVDPAFRTGCKLAVIDENGKYLDHAVIYPTAPHNDFDKSFDTVEKLLKKYNISGVAIGNGTASRETQDFFAHFNQKSDYKIKYTVVSEAGASVYSASKVASQEYPNLDVTIRGAISIAQRLRDPMAALVKIDPKSLGIGQYQHDVDQKLLSYKLHQKVEDIVNHVGVDLNSASVSLLSYVSGVGEKLAKKIVKHREDNGVFESKKELLKVKGLGAKAFEQCAGFMRIRDGKSIFDNTGIHPESYNIAQKLQQLSQVDIESFSKQHKVGKETIKDILHELKKPGFDPRSELPQIPFLESVTDIEKLQIGSIVSGVVRNIADFGVFVDIGLKNDGMIHISKISNKRISHPLEVLSINQYLPRIEVIGIDLTKGKISLSLKG